MTTGTTTSDPAHLRAALADYIRGRKTFRTSRVEDAFRTVPRHVFLPGVDLETAYAPRQVVIKRVDDGAVSSASSPNLVAEMLELLDVQRGHRVLEIGAATGINAALLAELTGPTGQVVTIELDDDLASGLLDPALRWAGATLYDGGTIAYITVKPHNDDTNELGVIAHGPDSAKLAAQTSDLLHRWDQKRPSQPTITARPAGSPHAQTPSATHIDRPHTHLAITWDQQGDRQRLPHTPPQQFSA